MGTARFVYTKRDITQARLPSAFYKHATVYAALQPSSRYVHTHTQIHNSATINDSYKKGDETNQNHREAVENILGYFHCNSQYVFEWYEHYFKFSHMKVLAKLFVLK